MTRILVAALGAAAVAAVPLTLLRARERHLERMRSKIATDAVPADQLV